MHRSSNFSFLFTQSQQIWAKKYILSFDEVANGALSDIWLFVQFCLWLEVGSWTILVAEWHDDIYHKDVPWRWWYVAQCGIYHKDDIHHEYDDM